MPNEEILIDKLRAGKFREVDNYLSQLDDEALREVVLVIVRDAFEDVRVDQDALINLLHFYPQAVHFIAGT